MNARHRDGRRALRTRIDHSTISSRQHQQITDDRGSLPLTDECGHLIARQHPGAIAQRVAPTFLYLACVPHLRVNVSSTRLTRNNPHTPTQGGRGGHVPDCRTINVDHPMIGGQDRTNTVRQAAQENSQAGVKLFDLADPCVGTDAVTVS